MRKVQAESTASSRCLSQVVCKPQTTPKLFASATSLARHFRGVQFASSSNPVSLTYHTCLPKLKLIDARLYHEPACVSALQDPHPSQMNSWQQQYGSPPMAHNPFLAQAMVFVAAQVRPSPSFSLAHPSRQVSSAMTSRGGTLLQHAVCSQLRRTSLQLPQPYHAFCLLTPWHGRSWHPICAE